MGIIPTPHWAVKKIKRSNSGNICLVPQTWLTKCYFSLAVSLGTEVWPAKRSEGRQIFHVLWVTMGEVRQPFYPGKAHHQRTWKLPSFLAAQRKAFNFSYFYPGNHNLHLQENEGVIFLLSRHLGWFIAALGVVNGGWSSSGFWRQAVPPPGTGVTPRCYCNLSGLLWAHWFFHRVICQALLSFPGQRVRGHGKRGSIAGGGPDASNESWVCFWSQVEMRMLPLLAWAEIALCSFRKFICCSFCFLKSLAICFCPPLKET